MLDRIVVLSLVRSLAALTAMLTAASVASAQPGDGAAPAGAPSDDRKIVNIASDPIGWIFGLYGLGVGVALRDRIALHADTNYYRDDTQSDSLKGYEVGLGVTLYPRRAFSGLLIEPGVRFRRLFGHCKGCGDFDGADLNTRTTTVGPEVLVGWQWMIDSTFNVAVAVGLLYNVNHEQVDSPIEPDGYIRIGFAL